MEFLIIAAIVVGYLIYMAWQKRHPEYIQARKQADAVKKSMESAEYLAISHNVLNNFRRYQMEIQKDLKYHFFVSDIYNPKSIDISNLSGAPNNNLTLAIIFFYIGDMPELIKENKLTYSEALKKKLLDELIEMELNTSYIGFGAQDICNIALNNYRSRRKHKKTS